MRRSYIILVGMAVILPLVLGGCKPEPAQDAESRTGKDVTVEDVKKEASEALDIAGKYASQRKAEYEKELAARLKDMEARLGELKAEAEKKGDKLDAERRKEIDALQKELDRLKLRLEELKGRSAKAWDLLKEQFEKDTENLDRELGKEKKLIQT
ncbi:MAG: hypothetical protein HZA22_13745 [Nitrospirae bacterium]|nr:hypothetical protein [Nitrospirota bacterium]MBI5694596.1 hypothetical protein [Nitrospirota bacterium]